jgi:hypothetical protein
MVTQENLTSQIFTVTAIIQKKHPELYLLLNETPLFLSCKKNNVCIWDLEQYLESIKIQLITFGKVNASVKMCE